MSQTNPPNFVIKRFFIEQEQLIVQIDLDENEQPLRLTKTVILPLTNPKNQKFYEQLQALLQDLYQRIQVELDEGLDP